MAIIRRMHCIVLMVVPGPVSTWWLYCVVCRVGRDIDSSCSLEGVVTYGIRAGSTRDLGFATAFVDMSWFYYTVAD
jgi:hypothetical protein